MAFTQSILKKCKLLQGDGNYDVAVEFVKKWGNINDNLQADLNSLTTKGIPVDIVFDQGIQNIKF
jgi:hypothetical protein